MNPAERAPEPGRKNPSDDPGLRSSEGEAYAIDWVHRESAVVELVDELENRAARRHRRRRRAVVAICSVTMLVMAGLVSHLWIQPGGSEPSSSSVSVAMPTRQSLADGSVVDLKDGAEISVNFTTALRRVTLQRGEAHFQVAKDFGRPFVVTVGHIDVRATGTAFLVAQDQASTEVLVTEGSVVVEKPEDSTEAFAAEMASSTPQTLAVLGAGNRLLIGASAAVAKQSDVETMAEPEIAERLAWRVPRLEFSGTPLAQAIEMFNRYNDVQLVLADRSLGKLKVSGFLRADKTETFLSLLEFDFGLTAEPRGSREIVLRRAP